MAQTIDEQLLDKADQILRVLVSMATRDMKQRDRIAFLNSVGFQPKSIADLVGTSPNTVNVELARLRKKGRAPRRATKQ